MSPAEFLAFAATLAAYVAVPGPNVAALASSTFALGRRHGMLMVCGFAIGDLLHLSLAVFGLALVLKTSAPALAAMKLAGALYLLSIACRLWHRTRSTATPCGGVQQSTAVSLLSGLSVAAGNPATPLFFLSIVPPLAIASSASLRFLLLLAAVTGLVRIAGGLPYVLLAARAERFFRKGAALAAINRLAACVIAASAAFVAASLL